MKKISNLRRMLLLIMFVIATQFTQAQDADKTVTITVSGSGKTQEEAKQTALRSAIEQAFGTFISSNTEILNDKLVKDEMVSVSNGNIQEYNVISEVQTPDGNWSNTVKAIVSINKLTSFCESKGVNVEFKGALFTLNVKQQILNEQNEIIAIRNMCKVIKEIIFKSFNYELKVSEPVSLNNDNKNWKIGLQVNVKPNQNFKLISQYFVNTLKGISLSNSEIENYLNLNKSVYDIAVSTLNLENSERENNVFYLRSKECIIEILELTNDFRHGIVNFKLTNGIETLYGDKIIQELKEQYNSDFKSAVIQYHEPKINDENFRPLFTNIFEHIHMPQSLFYIKCQSHYYDDRYFNFYLNSKSDFDEKAYSFYSNFSTRDINKKYCNFLDFLSRISYIRDHRLKNFNLVLSFYEIDKEDNNNIVISLSDKRTLDELNKITEYKVSAQ